MKIEKTNASQLPRVFYCRHMQAGIAKYENETILVDTDGMKSLLASTSGLGIPVYIGHKNVDLRNIKEEAAGYVTESFYNTLDGWGWFKFVAIDDSAHDVIKKGWSVSNAYMPTEWGGGGTKNNCPYDREVKNGNFTHLAIVPNPRYEGACIMSPEEFKNYQDDLKKKLAELQNSKTKGKTMFKLFKTKKEEVSTIEGDTSIELANGKTVTIEEMVNAVSAKEKEVENMVEVNGKKIPLKDLVAKFNEIENAKTKKNEDDDTYKKDAEKENEDEDDSEGDEDLKDKIEKKNKKAKMNEDEDKKDKEKTNASDDSDKFFNELRNANMKRSTETAHTIVTSIDAVERGKKQYGSKK